MGRSKKPRRDIEKSYPPKEMVKKLRRLADCIEEGRPFQIQVGGERIAVPPRAHLNIEHERGLSEEEVEFQIKWPLSQSPIGGKRGKRKG